MNASGRQGRAAGEGVRAGLAGQGRWQVIRVIRVIRVIGEVIQVIGERRR